MARGAHEIRWCWSPSLVNWHMKTLHPNSPARILIADDHAIFAEALRVYLETTFTVIGVVADGRAMVQKPSDSGQM